MRDMWHDQSQPFFARHARRHRGFTLVEVLVVVTILGIASAIVVPNMLSSGTMVAQAATRAVVADISAAQSETIAQQQPMFVVFQPSENRYKLITDQNKVFSEQWNSAAGSGWVDFDENGRFQGVKLVSAELSGSALPSKGDYPAERVVKFSALGSPDSGGTIKLEYNGHPYVIDLAAFTGRVTVRRENG